MLRDRGLRQRQFVHDVAAHPSLFPGQHPQDSHTSRMCNRLGERGQLVVGGRFLHRGPKQLNRLSLGWTANLVV